MEQKHEVNKNRSNTKASDKVFSSLSVPKARVHDIYHTQTIGTIIIVHLNCINCSKFKAFKTQSISNVHNSKRIMIIFVVVFTRIAKLLYITKDINVNWDFCLL